MKLCLFENNKGLMYWVALSCMTVIFWSIKRKDRILQWTNKIVIYWFHTIKKMSRIKNIT